MFSESVKHTLPLLVRLHELIMDERQALTGREPAALEQVVQQKLAVVEEITPLLQERDALQRRLGAAEGIAGGDQLVKSAPQESQVREQWDALRAQAQLVEKDNALNGHLALQGEKAARMGISLLTGRKAEPALYGRNGENGVSLSGHTLAKA
jgi:flagellar biosynthesis/type III secretory pathway chaperone